MLSPSCPPPFGTEGCICATGVLIERRVGFNATALVHGREEGRGGVRREEKVRLRTLEEKNLADADGD